MLLEPMKTFRLGTEHFLVSLSLNRDVRVCVAISALPCCRQRAQNRVFLLAMLFMQRLLVGTQGGGTLVLEPVVSQNTSEAERSLEGLEPRAFAQTDFSDEPEQNCAALGVKLLFTGGKDGILRVWNMSRTLRDPMTPPKCKLAFEGHTAAINALDTHRGVVATASDDGTCRVWHIRSNAVHVLPGIGKSAIGNKLPPALRRKRRPPSSEIRYKYFNARFSHNGSRLYTLESSRVGWTVLACWRLADGPPPPSSNTVVEEAREAARPGRPVASPSTSPRGKGEESTVAGTPETPAKSGSSEAVAGSAIRQRRRRDGRDDVGGEGGESHRAATGEGAQSGQAVRDPRQTHWELCTWRCISNEPSMALAVGPPGCDWVAVGDRSGTVFVVNSETLAVHMTKRAVHGIHVGALAFSSDGGYVISGSADSTCVVTPIVPDAGPGEWFPWLLFFLAFAGIVGWLCWLGSEV